jgi:hypothetical protein
MSFSGENNEFDAWRDYAVSVNENIQLKYYDVKFVELDTAPSGVRKVLIKWF